MQKVGLISLFVVLLAQGAFGLTLSLEDATELFAIAGGSHTINALATSTDFANHTLFEIYHKNVLTNAVRLVVTMEEFNATSATVESGYGIAVTESGMTKNVSFTIDALSFQDDGAFEFHALSTSGDTNETVTKQLTVVVIPDTVKIIFGGRSPVESNSSSAVEVSSGNITVYCVVEESNPEITDISLTLNGDAVTLASGPDSELITAGERKYSNNVSAIVEVASNTSGTQALECIATDYLGDVHARQFLYTLNGVREGQTPTVGLLVLLLAFLLWHTL